MHSLEHILHIFQGETVTCENSFVQIMEDEQARELETIRQMCSCISNIDM